MRLLLATLAALCWGAAAMAAEWVIDRGASELAFVYIIDGEEREGVFSAFAGRARFDPDALLDAEMTFDIETASIDAGEAFATEFVRSIDWLWVEEHPLARYELLSLKRIGGDRYVARGALTLRGRTHPVIGEMAIALTETTATATGEARFDRKQFGVGVGFTTLFVEVGAEIAVRFRLTARPGG